MAEVRIQLDPSYSGHGVMSLMDLLLRVSIATICSSGGFGKYFETDDTDPSAPDMISRSSEVRNEDVDGKAQGNREESVGITHVVHGLMILNMRSIGC